MMKTCKGILGLLLVSCLVVCFAACGNNKALSETDTAGLSRESETEKAKIPETGEIPQEEDKEIVHSETEFQGTEPKVLVAYFSATGNTKDVAEKLAELTEGELYEIVPLEPYTSEDLNYHDSQSRTSLEMNDESARPEIGSETISLESYSTLYLGYPIWHGQAPRIMDTFVESYSFDGITVIPFCTSGSSGIGTSAQRLAELAGNGTWLTGQRFSSNVSESDLQAWMEDLEEEPM